MPTWSFRDRETGEVFDKYFHGSTAWDDRDVFLKENPQLDLTLTSAPALGDTMRMSVPGTYKADSTFEKYVINRIKETVPGNTVKAGHKTKMNREW